MKYIDRQAALALAALLVLVAAVGALPLLLARSETPSTAAGLVPADALAYVRVGTDPESEEDRRLAATVLRLPGSTRVRDRLLAALAPAGGVDLRRDVRPWLGDEAAVALLPTGGGRFGSAVLATVERRPAAEALLQRAGAERAGVRYRGIVVRRFGTGAAAFVEDYLVAGPEPAVRAVIDTAEGSRSSLGESEAFEAALAETPEDAPLQAYASPTGVRGLGRAQPGVIGVLAGLLDHPRLRAAGLSGRTDGARVKLSARRVGAGGASYAPVLLARAPGDAVAYAGAPSAAALAALLGRLGAGPALARLRSALPESAGVDLDRDLLGPLRGEAAFWATPGGAAPVLTLAARTRDPRRTRDALARLQGPVSTLLAGDPQGAAAFESADLAGLQGFTLPATPLFAPTYAVTEDTLILSTAPAGLEGFARRQGRRLPAVPTFKSAIPEVPAKVEAVGFLDPRRLLALAEQSGLTDGPLSGEARDDLRRVRAAGAVVQRKETDTTAELIFEIP